MSTNKSRRPSGGSAAARARRSGAGSAKARGASSGRGSNTTTWVIAGVVVVIGVALVAALVIGRSGGSTAPQPVASDLVKQVTSVPASVQATVGTGSVTNFPAKLTGAPPLTADGKPLVLYMGAEYCPYCAAERWSIVQALSKFGTFTGLKTTHSSSTDVFPSTQTFTFVDAKYTSDYLTFQSVETQGNELSGSGYPTLQTPTAEQARIAQTYGSPPYAPQQLSQSIPFIVFGNQFVVSGATYSPQVLQGLSAEEIAKALKDPTSDVAKGSVGAANVLTAVLCDLTGGQPGTVCQSPTVTQIQGQLAKK